MLKIKNTKCECGHQNSVGTVLCESCGKPLYDTGESKEPLEMRYDGVARRSQKRNPNIIDRVWNFFSSVKIAIYIILMLFVTSMLGTIYPQESAFINNFDPATYYKESYGLPGQIYYALGLSHTYESWWFIGLLVMLGTSLVICSLDRVLPLYRALKKQQIRKHPDFILRQKTVYKTTVADNQEQWTEEFGKQMKRKGYKVHREGTALLAEKNRFSRWGPYINHIGLILFLLAMLGRSIPGWHMDSYVSIPDGETVHITDTGYYVKNEKFTVDFYEDDELPDELKGTSRAKLFRTEAILYSCNSNCDNPGKEPELVELHRQEIIVNEPLVYKGFKLYQFDFDLNPKLRAVKPTLFDKQTGTAYGSFDLTMKEPQLEYKLGDYTLELMASYMEFALNSKGEPTTLSREPNAPAFIFSIKGPGIAPEGEPYMYFPMQKDKARFAQDKINGKLAEKLEIRVEGMENVDFSQATTVLNVRIDKAIPYLWIGAFFSMLGLLMGSYWQHRRVWLRIDDDQLIMGAHTNKNWFGMRGDVAACLKKIGIEVDPKSLDNGGNKT